MRGLRSVPRHYLWHIDKIQGCLLAIVDSGLFIKALNDGTPIEPLFWNILKRFHQVDMNPISLYRSLVKKQVAVQETALRPVHGWSPRTGWCKWPNCPDAASCRSLQRMVSASLHPATTRRGSSPLKPDTPTWRYKKNPENRLVSLKSFEAYLVVVGFDFLHSTCEARAAWFSSGDQRNAPTWDVGSAVPWPWKPLAMENRRVFLPVGEFCSKTFEESLTRAFLGSLWGAS